MTTDTTLDTISPLASLMLTVTADGVFCSERSKLPGIVEPQGVGNVYVPCHLTVKQAAEYLYTHYNNVPPHITVEVFVTDVQYATAVRGTVCGVPVWSIVPEIKYRVRRSVMGFNAQNVSTKWCSPDNLSHVEAIGYMSRIQQAEGLEEGYKGNILYKNTDADGNSILWSLVKCGDIDLFEGTQEYNGEYDEPQGD